MAADFYNNDVILFFADKILAKEAEKEDWKPVGAISQRGFNHNQQTTQHIKNTVPRYTIQDKEILEKIL